MEITGEQSIGLSRDQVWRALNDPEVLKQCIPACESVERVSEEELRIVMMAALGPVKARFVAKLRYARVQAPESCSMIFEGNGGPAGFGKGEASVTLTPQQSSTLLRYNASAHVGGRLAQIGARLVDAAAAKTAADFFANFNRIVVPSPAQETAPERASAGASAPAHSKSMPLWLWCVLAALVAAAIAMVSYLR